MLPPSMLSADDVGMGARSTIGAVAQDLGHGLVEAPAQILRGGIKAVNETSNAIYDGATWLQSKVGIQDGSPAVNPFQIPDSVTPGAAKTTTGGLIEGAAQFGTGMLGAGKFLRLFGVAAEGYGLVRAGVESLKGGASMALAFDPHEQRLSNLVEQFPALQNPVTGFLAANKDDGEAVARLKAGLEGVGLGAATEGFMGGLKALKSYYAGDAAQAIDHAHPEGAEKAVEAPEAAAATGTPGEPAKASGEAPGAGTGTVEDPIQLPAVEVKSEPEQMDFFKENPDADGKGAAPDSPKEDMDANPTAAAAPDASAPKAKKLVELTPADIDQVRELKDNVDKAPATDGDGLFTPLHGINTDLIEHSGDLSEILSTLRTYSREAMDGVTGGTESADGVARPVRSWAEVRANADKIADAVGADPATFIQRLGNMAGNTQNLDAELRVSGNLLATVGDKVSRLAKALNDPAGLELAGYGSRGELMDAFGKHVELLSHIQANYQGTQTNIARALNAFKMGAKIDPVLISAIRNPDDLFTLARQIEAGGGNIVNVAKQTRPGFWSKLLGATNEYWINSVLSGPKTHVVNMLGNTLSAALLPGERMLAGGLKMATPAGRQEFMEGGLHYAGMVMSLRDATTMAYRALKMGSGILDAQHNPIAELGEPAISAAAAGINPDTVSGVITNGLGAVIRLPSRLLTAEDEFFKQLVYRGAVRATELRKGLQDGSWRDPAAMADRMSTAVDAAAQGKPNEEALSMARYATFQNDLGAQTMTGNSTIGESLQAMSQEHPMLKMILPFVRTPTNMMRYTWDRSPGLNLLRTQYRNDLMGSNGPAAQASSAAKMLTGGTLWATAISYVMDGHITGGGPADPASQKALRATGWQPYSVKMVGDDGSVSYRGYDRLDPFGGIFGLAADFGEVAMQHPERDVGQTAASMVAALAKNLESKTYVSGLVRAFGALGDPTANKGQAFAGGLLGGFVPSFLRQTMMSDDTMHEARSLVDAMRARTPGYAEALDPQRNILGAEVHQAPSWGPDWLSPIAQTSHPAGMQPLDADWRNTVQARPEDELARLFYNRGAGIQPPPKSIGQFDMTQLPSSVTGKTVYDRLQELTGTVQMNGKTLRDTIADTVKQDYYRNSLTDGDITEPGSRMGVMSKLVGGYREIAQQELGKEQPIVHDMIMNEKMRLARGRYQ